MNSETQQTNITHRKAYDALIQQGIDRWEDLGICLDHEKKEGIFSHWQSADFLRNISIYNFYNECNTTIDPHESEQWLLKIMEVLTTAPVQPAEQGYDTRLLSFLLTLFGPFVPIKSLLQEPRLEAWINIYSNGVFSSLFKYQKEIARPENMITAIGKIQSPQAAAWILSVYYNDAFERVDYKEHKNLTKQFYTIAEQLFLVKPEIFQYAHENSDHGESNLVRMTNSAEILAYTARHTKIIHSWDKDRLENIVYHYSDLCEDNIKLLDGWSEFTDLAQQYPALFRSHIAVGGGIPELLWQSGVAKNRQAAFRQYLFLLQQDYDTYRVTINECMQIDKSVCMEALGDDYYDSPFHYLNADVLARLLDEPESIFIPYILDTIGYHCLDSSCKKYRKILDKVLQEQPQLLDQINGRYAAIFIQAKQFKDEATFTQADSELRKIVNRSKSGQTALVKLFSGKKKFTMDLLSDWTRDKRKKIRDFAYDCIIKSKQASVELLQEMSANKKYSTEQRSRIYQLLEKQGVQVKAPDIAEDKIPETLPELLEQAAKEKIRKKKLYNDLWDDRYPEQLSPLNEAAVRWLLSLMADMGKEKTALPLLAKRLLSHVPDTGQLAFAKTLLDHWLAVNVSVTYAWLIPVLGKLGSNELIETLFNAVNSWRKGTDQNKGVRCLRILGLLDSNHALSCVYDAYSKRGYGYLIYEESDKILSRAAKSRKIARQDLYDQLLPDFGLSSEGLLLDAGARSYQLNIGQDLNLKITNLDSGRITKTLPKAKKDEDPQKRVIIEEKYNYLRRNIKKVAKQQAQRMEEAAVVGRSWPYEQWQILFLQHPLLVIMGQSLIWQRLDKKKKPKGSFRIAEDLSLIDNEDEPVSIDSSEAISLWHPVNDTEEALAAWQEHLADYELNPIVDQLNLPRHQLSADEAKQNALTRVKGSKLTTGNAKRLLNKWGYERSGVNDSSYSDVWDKYFTLTGWQVSIEFDDFRIYNEYDETVSVLQFTFEQARNRDVKLKDVPGGIMAMAIEQGIMMQDAS